MSFNPAVRDCIRDACRDAIRYTGIISVPGTIINAIGTTVNEGKDVQLERLLNNVDTNRTGFKLALMTNAAGLDETAVLSDITFVTGAEEHTDPELLNVDATATGTNTPDFAWSGSAWSNTGGQLTAGSISILNGVFTPIIGKLYKIEYKISSVGSFVHNFSGSTLPIGIGTYTEYRRATNTTPVSILPNTGTVLEYYRVSEVIEDDLAYADWTVTQNTPAGTGYTASHPQSTLTMTKDVTGITGAVIYTTGTAAKLVHHCYSGTSVNKLSSEEYKVTPSIESTSGTNGIIPDEGAQDILNIMYKDVDLNSNTGYNLYCELYTNVTGMDEEQDYYSVTNPSGGSYDRVQVTAGSWTVSGGSATHADVVFPTATADWTGAVVGMTLSTNGTTRRIYTMDAHTSAVSVLNGDTYQVEFV
jgi:hypothetical protein